MEEKDAAPLVICPHCNSEIKKEAKFCPQCGKKLAIVNYCFRCGTKIEKDEKYCSNCGRDLGLETPVTPTPTAVVPTPRPILKRPTGIIIVSILWFLGGSYNTLMGLGGLVADLNAIGRFLRGYRFADQAANSYFSWALPVEAVIMLLVIALGLIQFVTIYGFLKGRSWSYSFGIGIPIVAVITSWSHMFLQLRAPPSVDITVNFLLPVGNIVTAIIYIAYLRQAHVRKWLRVDTERMNSNSLK